ncbi:cyclophilin-like fold protein [Rubellimicrobium aerolatum]|uniref:Cyclophilin-like fold protein n=1 Tax=Rubellimicrobium aerolatum TaxID=490979 RepID=A0ABW0SFB4_9RHOB|nr:cyclophilin-like fold protein [Rubellimicrobium aerolatum]MBP1807059.1 hypothetical protein [Rubellimicrobium aerolatum]
MTEHDIIDPERPTGVDAGRRDLLAVDLRIEDHAPNEKIADLPRLLTTEGSGPFGGEAPGDLCHHAPWRNLALLRSGSRWSRGPVRLVRPGGGPGPLPARGGFPPRVERLGRAAPSEPDTGAVPG